jgi:hypothetical protein
MHIKCDISYMLYVVNIVVVKISSTGCPHMVNKKKKTMKAPLFDIKTIIANLERGEGAVIGLEADMGNVRAEAVIAQYVWFLKHPKDPRRILLLQQCYAQYRKTKAPLGVAPSN